MIKYDKFHDVKKSDYLKQRIDIKMKRFIINMSLRRNTVMIYSNTEKVL